MKYLNKIGGLALFITIFSFALIACSTNTELDKCKTGDYKAERDCYTALAYNKVDSRICENMPDDVNERQANKAFCLGFIASATGDLRICGNQKNDYYKNTCEIIYEKYFMSLDPEFEELKNKYHSQTVSTLGLLNSDQIEWYCQRTDSKNINKCVKNTEKNPNLGNFNYAFEICKGIQGDRGYKCVVSIVKKADYTDYKKILTFCRDSGGVFHVASHFCIDPLREYYYEKEYVDQEWLDSFSCPDCRT